MEKGHKCITIEQMHQWEKEKDIKKIDEATRKASSCPLCRRIWMRFWASQPSSIDKCS